jgi:hypothetical protein
MNYEKMIEKYASFVKRLPLFKDEFIKLIDKYKIGVGENIDEEPVFIDLERSVINLEEYKKYLIIDCKTYCKQGNKIIKHYTKKIAEEKHEQSKKTKKHI